MDKYIYLKYSKSLKYFKPSNFFPFSRSLNYFGIFVLSLKTVLAVGLVSWLSFLNPRHQVIAMDTIISPPSFLLVSSNNSNSFNPNDMCVTTICVTFIYMTWEWI
jgi:hypothetical protein